MTNYKGTAQQFYYGGIARNLTNEQLKNFVILIGVNTHLTTPAAMRKNTVDYQVPSGKTFIALAITYESHGTLGYIEIHQGDTAAAITLLKERIHSSGATGALHTIPTTITFASEKFVTTDANSGSLFTNIIIYGYEE